MSGTGVPGTRPRRVAALILAAGLSRRMGPVNKILTTNAQGETMIARVVGAAEASLAARVFVVLGHQAALVEVALSGRDVTFVHADHYRKGLAASLGAGIAAVPADCEAVIVCLGDMPLVTAAIIDRVIAGYDLDQGRLIVVPTWRGQRGNPVLWHRDFFPGMQALQGDRGARPLLTRHAASLVEIDAGCDAVLTDFDTLEALAGLAPARPP